MFPTLLHGAGVIISLKLFEIALFDSLKGSGQRLKPLGNESNARPPERPDQNRTYHDQNEERVAHQLRAGWDEIVQCRIGAHDERPWAEIIQSAVHGEASRGDWGLGVRGERPRVVKQTAGKVLELAILFELRGAPEPASCQ